MNESNRPSLLVFQAGAVDSLTTLERLVIGAQHACTLDLLRLAAQSDAFARAVLVTDDARLAQAATLLLQGAGLQLPLLVEESGEEPFHFGETLHRVCRKHSIERVVYIGGGAMPLATPQAVRDLAQAVSGEGFCVTSNNLYSADLAAFYPASALERIELPPTDNDLAWRLHFRAGLPFAPTPRTLATQFDIDTPTDLAALWMFGKSTPTRGAKSSTRDVQTRLGSHLTELLPQVPRIMPRLADNIRDVFQVMSTKRAQLLVAGRVGSWVWRRLEVNLPCQTRIFSEERGMQASGRDVRGEVRTLLGLYVDAKGVNATIKAMEQLCDAAVLDTRVLFAHRKLTVSRTDRFASDALLPYEVSDGWVRDLTAAAALASFPILLGGHSLISGGLWALSELVRTIGPLR